MQDHHFPGTAPTCRVLLKARNDIDLIAGDQIGPARLAEWNGDLHRLMGVANKTFALEARVIVKAQTVDVAMEVTALSLGA